MARDIYAETLAEMVEICTLLTERGHGFDATLTTAGNWRIRLTGASRLIPRPIADNSEGELKMKIQTLDQIVTALETGWFVSPVAVRRLVLGVEQGIKNISGHKSLVEEVEAYEAALARLRDAEERATRGDRENRVAAIEDLRAARTLCPDLSWY